MNANSCYVKFPQPASRYPYVGCGVGPLVQMAETVLTSVLASVESVNGLFPDAGIENALKGQALNASSIAAAAEKAAEGKAVLSDHFVSEEYRRRNVQSFCQAAITKVS
ncbi:MAG: hypothetical protein Ct9H90mP9_5030 [Pseudomonadota bacterium]|nr:MAG: hypothetical protein Ct9H90mP9_5030 [Pseudomonadota bacterium]